MSHPQGPICGIDLGTTFSSIGFLNAFGRAEVVPTADGQRCIPSVVLFPPGGGPPLVGRQAKERSAEQPDRVVEFVKREMGDADWRFAVDGQEYTPEAISAIILRAMVGLAEQRLGERPRQAVITCPAYFGDLERQATAEAGRLAGLEVLSVFNEPTAAALAYGLHRQAEGRRVRAMVYDLGGGTFDVTVLELEGRKVHVLATAGEHRLGGKDWDDELVNHVAARFEAEHGVDPREDAVAGQDLRNRCEAAKVSLSSKLKAAVFCRAGGKTSKVEVTRSEFEALTRPLLLQTKTYVDQVLKAASASWEQIDVILPVGGSSYMPQVRELLRQASGREPEVLVDPELAVVQGATYYAALHLAKQGFEIKVFGVGGAPAAPKGAPKATPPTGPATKGPAPKGPAPAPNGPAKGSAPKGPAAPERAPAPPAEVDEALPALPPTSMEDVPELLCLPGQVGEEVAGALPGAGPEDAVASLPGGLGPAPAEARPLFARPSAPPPPGRPAPLPKAPALAASSEFDPFGWPIDPTRTVQYDFADLVAMGDQRLQTSMELTPQERARRLADVVQNVNARPLGVLVFSQGRPKTSVMIRANTPLPAMQINRFFTIKDGQTAVKVVVLEGDSPDPDACTRVGECVVSGLPSRPKGQEVEIIYSYDPDGRIVIAARDVGTGHQAEVELRRSNARSEEERARQQALVGR